MSVIVRPPCPLASETVTKIVSPVVDVNDVQVVVFALDVSAFRELATEAATSPPYVAVRMPEPLGVMVSVFPEVVSGMSAGVESPKACATIGLTLLFSVPR